MARSSRIWASERVPVNGTTSICVGSSDLFFLCLYFVDVLLWAGIVSGRDSPRNTGKHPAQIGVGTNPARLGVVTSPVMCAPAVGRRPRPLAGRVGLPHPLLVDVARAGDRRRRRRRGAGPGRGAAPDAAAPGRQRHRRAAAHQPRTGAARPTTRTPGRSRSSSTWRPASAARASAPSARCCARLCGAEAAIVVNNGAAAVLLVLAALAAGRDVPVSRGESVEIGGGFRVPEVMAQSGARLVEVGTTNRTRLADYRRRSPTRDDVALVLKVHPSNYRVDGFTEDASVAELATLGAARRRRPRLRPARRRRARGWPGGPAGVAGRRAGRPSDARRRRRARHVQRRQAARRAAGRHHRRAGRPRRALRRATRWPAPCGPAASCSPPCRTSPSPTSAATSSTAIPFWRMAATPVDELAGRAQALAAADRRRRASRPTPLPGAGSAPGATIPSAGVARRRRPPRRAPGPRPAGHRPGPRRRHGPRPAHRRPGRRRRHRRRAAPSG